MKATAPITLTRNESDGLYGGSDGNIYTAIKRGKTAPVITGYLQVFRGDIRNDYYSVPGKSRFIHA